MRRSSWRSGRSRSSCRQTRSAAPDSANFCPNTAKRANVRSRVCRSEAELGACAGESLKQWLALRLPRPVNAEQPREGGCNPELTDGLRLAPLGHARTCHEDRHLSIIIV